MLPDTPIELGRAARNVRGPSASAARPPAPRRVLCEVRIARTAAVDGLVEVGDVAEVDLREPLLDLGRVNGRDLVQRWVVGRVERSDGRQRRCARERRRSTRGEGGEHAQWSLNGGI